MLLEAYVKADQFLVDRASEAVKAWNWTTGRTRAELANVVNIISQSLVVFSTPLPEDYLIKTPAALLSTYLMNTFYNNKDENDERFKKRESLKSNPVEDEALCFAFSPVSFALAGLVPNTLNKLGMTGVGLSAYIMRADYQAPRRNVLSRAKDRLIKMMRAQNPVPDFSAG